MLSILIPTYNYNCYKLVADLQNQADKCSIAYEICVMDDGSTTQKEENRKISELSCCRYVELSQNVGRSRIRNLLAAEARYNYFLFIDNDAAVDNVQYIANYLPYIKTHADVVIGGTAYNADFDNPDYSLRVTYGIQREGNSAYKHHFTTFNFLIRKDVFEQVRFCESIEGYGHEDTLFGLQLQQQGFQLEYINNRLIHCGLNTNEVFIEKTCHACQNLLLLHKKFPSYKIEKVSKIVRCFDILQKMHLTKAVSILYKLLDKSIRKQLCSSHPSLFLFDCYKIGYMCSACLPHIGTT